ncbi:MAG: hypothetical protein ACHP79_16270, partial [Terriglobales bacterium]
ASNGDADVKDFAPRTAGRMLQDLAKLHRLGRSVVEAEVATADHALLTKKPSGTVMEMAEDETG